MAVTGARGAPSIPGEVADSPGEPVILPQWPDATVLILVTGGGHPHAIPVSAAIRASERTALLGLAHSRGSLARLRDDPRVALSITFEGVAVTAYGRARIHTDDLTEGMAAVEVAVDHVQDHGRPTFVIEGGVSWHWSDEQARERDRAVRDALRRLAGRPG